MKSHEQEGRSDVGSRRAARETCERGGPSSGIGVHTDQRLNGKEPGRVARRRISEGVGHKASGLGVRAGQDELGRPQHRGVDRQVAADCSALEIIATRKASLGSCPSRFARPTRAIGCMATRSTAR